MNFKDHIKELQKYVFNGEEENISDWFIKHDIVKNKKLRSMIVSQIRNDSYFFSFRCVTFQKEYIEKEEIKRHRAILKNFKLDEQIDILSSMALENKFMLKEYVDLLNINNKREVNKVINNNSFSYICVKAFNVENFEFLDELEKKLKSPFMQIKQSLVPVYHKDKNNHGGFYIKLKEKLFPIAFEIALNYTENKKNYLKQKGIDLPTEEEIIFFNEQLNQSLEKDEFFSQRGYEHIVNEKIQYYLKNYRYEYLNKKIIKIDEPSLAKKSNKI